MSFSQKTTIHAELGWLRESTAANMHQTQRGALRKTLEFISTTENTDSAANEMTVWSEKNLTIPAGGIHTLDLLALPCPVFDDYIPLRFTAIGALFLVNHSPSATLILGSGDQSAWAGFFGGATHSIHIPAEGFFCVSAPNALWAVTAESGLLKIHNPHPTQAVYDLALCGKKYAPAEDETEGSSSSGSGSA